VDEDDEDVLASTATTEGDSDSDNGSLDRAPSVMDMEAEEGSDDDDDDEDEYDYYDGDVDEVEMQTMVAPQRANATTVPRDPDATTVPKYPDATTVPKPAQANATTIPKPAPKPISNRLVYGVIRPRVESDGEDEDVAFDALSEKEQINRARATLKFNFNIPDADVRAVDFAIEVGRYTIPPRGKLLAEDRLDLCAAIRKRKEVDAVRALQLVQQAQASDKSKAVSNVEKLVFVQCKAMVHFRTPYEMDLRRRMFQLLTGRGDNWWDKHNKTALARM
jgi:hypothetical protein